MQNNYSCRIPVVLSTLVLITIFSCNKKKKSVTPDVQVNPAFEMTPPVTSDITVEFLKEPSADGNVLIKANLSQAAITDTFHAIMVGDEKLILRDDGLNGDDKARDGIFSIIIKDDVNQIRSELNEVQKENSSLLANQRQLFKWVKRSAVPVSDKIRKVSAFRFDTSTIIRIDPDILFTTTPDPVLNDHSLMITDLGVVEDPQRTFNPCTNAGNPDGAWTFGKLMTDMANTTSTGISGENFVKEWLNNWMIDQTINGDPVPARVSILNRIIVPWIIKSNPAIPPASVTAANWKTFPLQLKFAPFKLLAIVNRVDLRGNSGYGISNAGEGRFVFGALTNTCAPLQNPGKFTVIFEYGVPKKTCSALRNYAKQWFDLKSMTPGTATYNQALQVITDQFASAGSGGIKPNGSSINQVRSNELAIGGTWELREFNVNKTTHLLEEATVKQEPAKRFNRLASPSATAADQAILASFVNGGGTTVPLTFSGTNFLGGKAHTENTNHFWDGSLITGAGFIIDNNKRHDLSLNTCSGCHGGEGKTSVGNLINDPAGIAHNPFLHISPQPFGTKTTLSAFLTGNPAVPDGLFRVNDPAGRPTGTPSVWTFNDLARRNVDLQELVNKTCKSRFFEIIRVLKFTPLNMTH